MDVFAQDLGGFGSADIFLEKNFDRRLLVYAEATDVFLYDGLKIEMADLKKLAASKGYGHSDDNYLNGAKNLALLISDHYSKFKQERFGAVFCDNVASDADSLSYAAVRHIDHSALKPEESCRLIGALIFDSATNDTTSNRENELYAACANFAKDYPDKYWEFASSAQRQCKKGELLAGNAYVMVPPGNAGLNAYTLAVQDCAPRNLERTIKERGMVLTDPPEISEILGAKKASVPSLR